MAGKMYALNVLPGIQRDGTTFSSRRWIDGQWCRFQRNLPRKIGGYSQIIGNLPTVPRGTFVVPNPANPSTFNIYVGSASGLVYQTVDQFGNPIGGLIDRTPVPFLVNDNYDWNFDVIYSAVDGSAQIVMHAAPNLVAIDNNIDAPVYYGPLNANTPLIPNGFSVSGGIVVLHPYLFMYGNDGNVIITNPGSLTSEFENVRVSGLKVVAALPTRGGNTAPAGLLWTLDSLIRVTQIGGSEPDFNFDTVTSKSSILSSRSVIQYDNQYFWAGNDRFLYYNGTVNELPNNTNLDYFFDNLNNQYSQKVWATKISEYGEIWWFYPAGNSTECNRALIYNVRENSWSDTAINRSDGYFSEVFAFPVWGDNRQNANNQYSLWLHDVGLDQNVNGTLTAIPFSVESSDIAFCAVSPDGNQVGVDRWVYLYRMEPDGIQSGQMNFIVNGRNYARAQNISSTYTFLPTDVKIDTREQRRIMTLRFENNAVGGDFQMGQILMDMRVGDARQ